MTAIGVVTFPGELNTIDDDDLIRKYNSDIELEKIKKEIKEMQNQLEPILDKFNIDYDWNICP